MPAVVRPQLSFEEYCLIERDSPVKHEYLDGQAWAMAGGSREHAARCANVLGMLAAQLRGTPCQAHTSDLRVRVRATGLTTYPDVTVICGRAEMDPEDRVGHTVLNPTLVVEVLSPSTEAYDRTEKLSHYQAIPSLREVILVAQDRGGLEIWRRGPRGAWEESRHGEGTVELVSIPCVLTVADVYTDPLAG